MNTTDNEVYKTARVIDFWLCLGRIDLKQTDHSPRSLKKTEFSSVTNFIHNTSSFLIDYLLDNSADFPELPIGRINIIVLSAEIDP
jgi:hypothetical protein